MSKLDHDRDFHKQVQKAVLSDAVQHPSTLMPAAVTLLSAAQMALMSPSKEAFALALFSGFLTLSSFIYHYVIRGEKNAKKFADKFRNQVEHNHLANLEELLAESRRSGFEVGIKEGGEFRDAYLKLTRYLKNLDNKSKDRVQRFLILAEDCYRQGLNILHDAVETHKVVFTFPIIQLRDEHAMWLDQAGDLEALIGKGQDHLQPKLEALRSKIQNHQTRIQTFRDKRNRLEQLMAQLESLESALETAHLEVVDLISGKTLLHIEVDPANQLEQAVLAAKRVEERLGQMGEQREDDQIYRDAAK